jgi:peptidyl-tRNA hydrolase, PTH2 family
MNAITMYAIVADEAVALCGGNRGKMAAQCGHAFVRCALVAAEKYLPERLEDYMKGEAKVVLRAPIADFEMLLEQHWDVPTSLVADAGHTVLEPGTITCIGIGPIYPSEASDDLRALRVWI